jgi:hypothetical protein
MCIRCCRMVRRIEKVVLRTSGLGARCRSNNEVENRRKVSGKIECKRLS